MTVLLVPPPPLPPVQEDLPQDIDFDFHMDFSLDPLPTFEWTTPAPQEYPESEHEPDSLRLSRTSQASLYSQYSNRTSLPSVRASREDPQSTTFWGNFGVSSDNLDHDPTDMTAPLNIVKREPGTLRDGLSDRTVGDRSGEPSSSQLHMLTAPQQSTGPRSPFLKSISIRQFCQPNRVPSVNVPSQESLWCLRTVSPFLTPPQPVPATMTSPQTFPTTTEMGGRSACSFRDSAIPLPHCHFATMHTARRKIMDS